MGVLRTPLPPPADIVLETNCRITKKMDLKFCPSCGGDTLLRTSTSTNGNGEVTVHLKKNMQWTNRGTKVPLPHKTHHHLSDTNGCSFRYRNQRG